MSHFRAVVWVVAAVGFVTGFTSPATAAVVGSTFSVAEIPDGDPSGLTLGFESAPAIASLDSVRVTLSHEWLGDLTLRVIPPAGAALTLFDRLGVAASEPDGSSAILGKFLFNAQNQGVLTPQTYTFAAAGADFAAAAADAVASQTAPVVPADQAFAAQSWNPGPFGAGDWHLLLADSSEVSIGYVTSAQLVFTPAVPEPGMGMLALISMGGGLFLRRGFRV